MTIHKLVAVAGIPLVAAIFTPAPSQAEESGSQVSGSGPTSSSSCILKKYQVSAVRPYKIDKNAGGHFVVSRTLGAEISVQAEPGLTAEWLWRTIDQHVAEMRGSAPMGDCPLDIDRVQVEVVSAGPGFTVRLSSPNAKSAEEILRRAQLLLAR